MSFLASSRPACIAASLIAADVLRQQRKKQGGQLSLRCFQKVPDSPKSMFGAPLHFERDAFIQKREADIHSEFMINGHIGEGGFGKVYSATHRRTQMQHAVKVIPKSAFRVEDFEHELDALKALDHPHVVKLVEWFEDNDNYYLVQELCVGPDLLDYLQARRGRHGIPEKDAAIIMRQCLKAVLACHANGIIHRDIKLENFMVAGGDKTIKMIDFGLATRLSHGCDTETSAGTFQYMAPEVLFPSKKGYGKPIDVWSLGVVLFVLLAREEFCPIRSAFAVGGQYEIRDCNSRWWPMGIIASNTDGTFDVRVKDVDQTLLQHVRMQDIRPSDKVEMKRLLLDPKYAQVRLATCRGLESRELSASARDLLSRMLQHDPLKRITPSEALSHPFIIESYHMHLDGTEASGNSKLDVTILQRMRMFAQAPRLKQIALLAMAHLASHDSRSKETILLQHVFRDIDEDGNGLISRQDFESSLIQHGVEVPPDLQEVWSHCDCDSNTLLNYIEFLACTFPPDMIKTRLCTEAFQLLDREYNGHINAEDLHLLCRSYKHEGREYEDIIREAERSMRSEAKLKGYLDLPDFLQFMLPGKTAWLASAWQRATHPV